MAYFKVTLKFMGPLPSGGLRSTGAILLFTAILLYILQYVIVQWKKQENNKVIDVCPAQVILNMHCSAFWCLETFIF